jgi:hypothetical protein
LVKALSICLVKLLETWGPLAFSSTLTHLERESGPYKIWRNISPKFFNTQWNICGESGQQGKFQAVQKMALVCVPCQFRRRVRKLEQAFRFVPET